MEIAKYKFKENKAPGGTLVSLEDKKELPFAVKRVYYLYGLDGNSVRGRHAHRTLQQLLVCLCGSCKLSLDNGSERQEFLLDNPAEGVLISAGMWREIYGCSSDTVLLVLASEIYDEEDYIRDYDEFLHFAKEK